MTRSPRVVIGAPLHNRADHLPAALESLLAQTERDFALVLVDDGSTDGTVEIAERYARADRRIVFRRNQTRVGMAENWRRTFELARELYPEAEFFAWASDHDLWHPGWLAALLGELERHADVVLAYPRNRRISERGEALKEPWAFDTFGLDDTFERFRKVVWRMRAGDMVYGLFRTQALLRAGIFRRVLLPDRLLLTEVGLAGQFRQVPEVLWQRRFRGLFSMARQRDALFPDGAPAWTKLPWWLVHAAILAGTLGIRATGRARIGRLAGFGYALAYLPLGVGLELRSRWIDDVRPLVRRVIGPLWRRAGALRPRPDPGMVRILFLMKGRGSVRSFESTLRLLLERGHQVHVALEAWDKDDRVSPTELVEALAEECPGLTHGPAPPRGADGWTLLADRLRFSLDYLRYLEPHYRDARKLRARAEKRAPGVVRCLARRWPVRTGPGLALFRRALRALEMAIPASSSIGRFLQEQQPDIVLVTPLVDLGSTQADYVRAARAIGIATGLCVRSWDNLTNKGMVRDAPDVVIVWNEAMKHEAVELQRVPPDRVVVAGAAIYDHWFDWSPSTSRLAFCRTVGLRADRPFLLYACSSGFIAPEEANFVRRWIGQLRSSDDARLRTAGVLIRPHPLNAGYWKAVDLSDLGDVVVWPKEGAVVADTMSKAAYYDSIYHSAAVMGVNTSALIESAIVGRSVYTLLAPEFRDTQEGTLHFRHLLWVNGGPLHVAGTFEQHWAQLAEGLTVGSDRDERTRQFLATFVRPHGLDVPATPEVVAAIERAALRPAPGWRARAGLTALVRAGMAAWVVRLLTHPERRPSIRRPGHVDRPPNGRLSSRLRGVRYPE